MNLKEAFAFSAIVFTCLPPNSIVACAAQTGVVLVDSEQDSRHQSTPHASTSLDGVSIANDNRILYDNDDYTRIPALDEPRCKNSPLKLLIETSGGSIFPLKCNWVSLTEEKTQCSETGVLASHCPKACGMCPLYKCSDSKGTFLMGNGSERNCSWLASLNPEQKRSRCKKSSFAKTCRATCKFCPSDDTESNQPSTELSTVPSAVPSFAPSLVSTNAPSVQLSDTPSKELSALPSGELSHQPSSSPSVFPDCDAGYYAYYIGDGFCHNSAPYNTEECGWDGGDCEEFNRLYPDCDAEYASNIGDGRCWNFAPYNTEECGYDGGDCEEFKRLYPDCDTEYAWYIGNGFCHNYAPYNTEECGYDGGDCPTPPE